MLASLYAAEGIVFAADSQITGSPDRAALPPQRKVLRVRGVGVGDGLIGYFGLAQVNGGPMTQWLRREARKWQGGSAESLADYLAGRLSSDLTSRERKEASRFHIGAFERRGEYILPVFVFLRNSHSLVNGIHGNVGKFHRDEQLLGDYWKHVSASDLRRALSQHQRKAGLPFWLRNGDLRFFGPVWDGVQQAAQLIVAQPGYQTPSMLSDWERFARTLIITTSQLYRVLYQSGAPLIGNKVVVESLPWP